MNLQVRDLPILQIFAVRCFIAALLLGCFALRSRPLLTRTSIAENALLGLFLIAAPVAFLTQASNISPGLATLLFAVTPLLAAVIENVVSTNDTGLGGAPYMLGGLLGMAFLVRGTLSFSASQGLSIVWIALAVFAVALSMVQAKQWLLHQNPAAAIAIQMCTAAVATGLFSLYRDGATIAGWQRSTLLWLVLLSALCSAMAYLIFYRLLAEYRASQLSVLQWIVPVLSLAETAAYIRHLPAWDAIGGGALAMLCALLMLRNRPVQIGESGSSLTLEITQRVAARMPSTELAQHSVNCDQ